MSEAGPDPDSATHLGGRRRPGGTGQAGGRRASSSPLTVAAAAVGVFVLAMLLITGIETAVLDRPISGGAAGDTTVTDLLDTPP